MFLVSLLNIVWLFVVKPSLWDQLGTIICLHFGLGTHSIGQERVLLLSVFLLLNVFFQCKVF